MVAPEHSLRWWRGWDTICGIEQLYVLSGASREQGSREGRPPESATVEELAEYWAAHEAELKELSSWMFRVRRRLGDAVRDGGPIITSSGRLGLEAAGYEYPAEIAQEFPGLGRHCVSAIVDTLEQAERILDLVSEEVPGAEVAHELKVDGRAASRLVQQGGTAAKRILDLRVPKGRLAVS
ncbi:MAG: hypothetical protein ABR573_07420 [Candidatus Dormibacteria bacterium]